MSDVYPFFDYNILNPNIRLFAPDSPTTITPPTTSKPNPNDEGDNEIVSISINDKTYKVVRLLFQTQTLIGRATKAFLVKLPDGSLGVLKDSWISSTRADEANFLKGLNILFGLRLIDHCVLRKTGTFQDNPINRCLKMECQEKWRILTYPAGIHISDFSCLWELTVALLDIVVCMINSMFLLTFLTFDMFSSYTVPRILPKDSP